VSLPKVQKKALGLSRMLSKIENGNMKIKYVLALTFFAFFCSHTNHQPETPKSLDVFHQSTTQPPNWTSAHPQRQPSQSMLTNSADNEPQIFTAFVDIGADSLFSMAETGEDQQFCRIGTNIIEGWTYKDVTYTVAVLGPQRRSRQQTEKSLYFQGTVYNISPPERNWTTSGARPNSTNLDMKAYDSEKGLLTIRYETDPVLNLFVQFRVLVNPHTGVVSTIESEFRRQTANGQSFEDMPMQIKIVCSSGLMAKMDL